MTAWWTGLPAAQATVTCGEHAHRLRWERGRLRALDHGDADDERALAALGGEPVPCIELLDAWRRHRDNPLALVLAPRAPGDVLRVDADAWRPGPGGGHGWVSYAGPARASVQLIAGRGAGRSAGGASTGRRSRRTDAELVRLLTLGGGIPERLVATVAATWARRLGGGGRDRADGRAVARTRPQLRAALHGRVTATLRTWLGEPDLRVETAMDPADAPRSLARTGDGVAARLPFAWLPEVWCRAQPTIYGRFVLGADTADGVTWRLDTVGPDLGDPEPVTLTLPT